MAIGDAVRKYIEGKAQAEALQQAEESVAVMDAPDPTPKAKEPTMAQALMELSSLLKSMQAVQGGEQQKAMLTQADILQQILIKTRPENSAGPDISIYSYPEGDRDRPKPALTCPVTWVGYELRTDTMTPEEILALNALRPGVFRVTKADSTKIEFRVTAVHNANLQLERVDVWFPCKGEARHNHASMLSYCQQATGTATPNVEDLLAQLAEMKRTLAAHTS